MASIPCIEDAIAIKDTLENLVLSTPENNFLSAWVGISLLSVVLLNLSNAMIESGFSESQYDSPPCVIECSALHRKNKMCRCKALGKFGSLQQQVQDGAG